MPKLDKKAQKVVEEAEEWGVGGFLLDEGRYAARLKDVTVHQGRAGEYWTWEFEHLHNEEGEPQRGRQWHNTSMSPKAAGNLKQVFNAFGYSSDSDTDEMIGEWVVLHLGIEVQEQGKRAGQQVNRIQGLAPFVAEDWDFDTDAVAEKVAASGDTEF